MKKIFILSFFLIGCVKYMPLMVSTNSINSKYEKPTRVVTGISSAYFICGLPISGDDSLNAAVADAMSYGRGDTLENVFIDRKIVGFPSIYFPIIGMVQTSILGTLVKYEVDNRNDFASTRIIKNSDGVKLQIVEDGDLKDFQKEYREKLKAIFDSACENFSVVKIDLTNKTFITGEIAKCVSGEMLINKKWITFDEVKDIKIIK